MKKITLLTAVLFAALISHAQITKGSTLIGGHINGSSQKDQAETSEDETKNSYWGAGLQLGKFIANNKAAGLFVNYSGSLNKQENSSSFYYSKTKSHTITAGIFYRQYFPLSTKWYLFGNADLGYSKGKSEENSNHIQTIKGKGWGVSTSITPGLSFAAGRRLFIETAFSDLVSLGYSKSRSDCYNTSGTFISGTKHESFGASANLSGFNNIQFGLRWILPG